MRGGWVECLSGVLWRKAERPSVLADPHKLGGVAALLAGVLFRRNIAAEISVFTHSSPPGTVEGWFRLLQSNRLLGLAYLSIFDVANYLLLGLMFVALYVALRRLNQGSMTAALALGLISTAIRA